MGYVNNESTKTITSAKQKKKWASWDCNCYIFLQ